MGDELEVYIHGPVTSVQGACIVAYLRRISGARFACMDELRSAKSFLARIRVWCAFALGNYVFLLSFASFFASFTRT